MTDRIFVLTVLLDKDVREDDAQPIIAAIRMIKRVSRVEPHVSDMGTWAAETRAREELERKLREAL